MPSRCRGMLLWHTRTAHGSRVAPMAWSIFFGLACKLVLAVVQRRCKSILQGYVDDPTLALAGTPQERTDGAALAMMVWALLGIELATKKGQLGTTIDWIGASFKLGRDRVEVTITEARVQKLRDLTE